MSLPEHHKSHRVGWLRASVLGANDGIVSTASLIVGVAAANATHADIMVAGVAGLVAGAMSMAAGEYVSVSSQSDTENADLAMELDSIANDYEYERTELANIYRARGLDAELADQVAEQLMNFDSLGAHARDELGIFERARARPLQAALSSGAAFTVGAALPLLATWLSPAPRIAIVVPLLSLLFLALLGALAARAGGAPIHKGALRVLILGSLAMGATALVGSVFGVVA